MESTRLDATSFFKVIQNPEPDFSFEEGEIAKRFSFMEGQLLMLLQCLLEPPIE